MTDADAYAAAELGTALRGGTADGIRPFAGLIDDSDTLRLLNYYDSLFDEAIEETEIGQEIIANAMTETVDRAVGEGSVSRMKNAMGLTGQSQDGKDLYARAAERLSHEGSIGLVFGPPGAGKTALTIDIARAWQVRTGGSLLGNTSWSGFDEKVKTDREAFEAMGSRQGQVLCVIDEAAQDLSGFGSGNKRAEQFSNSLLFIRKREFDHGDYAKRGSVLIVAHTRKKTAKSIRRVASFGIEKPSRSNPDKARLLDSEGGKDSWESAASFQGLTDTSASYAEHEASSFEIEMGDDEDEEDDGEDPDRQRQIKTVIKAVKGEGMKRKDAASLVDYTRHWVGNRIQEWENGEHRDLVSEADLDSE